MKFVIRSARAATIAAAAVLVCAQSASAQSVGAFQSCDGFGAPSKSGDGMSRQAMVLGIFVPQGDGGTTVQQDVSAGRRGVTACDEALADPRLLATYWRRKVSLLRARALHQAADGDFPGALADLDRAAQAAVDPADPYYQRSLGLGLDLARAMVLRLSGDQPAATALALKAWEQRPYDRATAVSALIAMGPDADDGAIRRVMEAGARVDPQLIDQLFTRAYDQRRFAEMVALRPQIRDPRLDLSNPRDLDASIARWTREREAFRASRSGQTAYALAALGRPDEARAMIAEARAALAKVVEPKPLPEKSSIMAYLRAQEAAKPRIARESGQILDEWSALVDLRVLASAGRYDEVLVAVVREPLPDTAMSVELIDTIERGLAKPDAPGLAALRLQRARIEARRRLDRSGPGVGDLVNLMPEAEVRERVERYRRPRPLTGWESMASDSSPAEAVTLSFHGFDSSPSMAQETVLLQAADYTRAQGKSAFVILNRGDTRHATQPTMYGAPAGPEHHTGYEVTLLILPVDPAALPADLKDAAWRVLDAEAVYAALKPLYIPPKKK